MNQSGNRNSILGWVKNLKHKTLLSDSVDQLPDDVNFSDSRSPSRASFQSGTPHASSPTKETLIPQPPNNAGMSLQNVPGPTDFLRPLLSHKSRSTNNVNNSGSISSPYNSPHQESSLRQHRDSFLQHNGLIDENSKYFGVPLEEAINQAAAKISILGPDTISESDENVLHYGRIPIVVAKCGVYLKKNGLNIEGLFRVGGSSKRIKELQIIFNTPPDFGKKLNWDGYTVHDAASLLRRYLNALPEPLIPLELYEEFRDPLRSRARVMKYLKYKADNPKSWNLNSQAPSTGSNVSPREKANPTSLQQGESQQIDTSENGPIDHQAESEKPSEAPSVKTRTKNKPKSYRSLTRDVYSAIEEYKQLLDDIPLLSKQLLFYILDLLAMVQNLSQENLMSARNLAAIFQPSILLHPNHDMDPEEYVLSQCVVEFLIQYAYKLLPNTESREPSISNAEFATSANPDKANLRMQHSQSLSGPNNDLDFIGYRSGIPTQTLAVSDAEHGFASASSDDEIYFHDDHKADESAIFPPSECKNENGSPSLTNVKRLHNVSQVDDHDELRSSEVPVVVLESDNQ